MSIQGIIDIAESVQINRRKVVGIQYTRNEIARVSELVTRNPWRFTVKVSALLNYTNPTVRALLEELDRKDRKLPESVTFSNNPNLSWMFKYQGAMTAAEINAITISRFGNATYDYNELVLTNLPSSGVNSLSTAVLFRKGDILQVEGYPYPFTVQNTTVLRGSSSTVTITTHRENFISTSVVGSGIEVGNNVDFNMLCTNMPTYTFVNKNTVQFDSDFDLYEYTGTIL